MMQHPTMNYGAGALGGLVSPLIIQALPDALIPRGGVEQALLYMFGAALAAFFAARLMASLNKIADLPDKQGWDSLTHTVNDTSRKLDIHIGGFDEWKRNMERRMSDAEHAQ